LNNNDKAVLKSIKRVKRLSAEGVGTTTLESPPTLILLWKIFTVLSKHEKNTEKYQNS
jgi:hypothetical protein